MKPFLQEPSNLETGKPGSLPLVNNIRYLHVTNISNMLVWCDVNCVELMRVPFLRTLQRVILLCGIGKWKEAGVKGEVPHREVSIYPQDHIHDI